MSAHTSLFNVTALLTLSAPSDPWWIFTTINLFYNISTRYSLSIPAIIRASPRFGVLLAAMTLSIGFIIVDICSVTHALASALPDGLNPFWKLAFVFKCLTDSIVLDDFKTALDKLCRYRMAHDPNAAADLALTADDSMPNVVCRASDSTDDQYKWARPRQGVEMIEDPLGDDADDRSRTRTRDRSVDLGAPPMCEVARSVKMPPAVMIKPTSSSESAEMTFAEFLDSSCSSAGK